MNLKINSSKFYERQNSEIKRYLNSNKKTLHVCMSQSNIIIDNDKKFEEIVLSKITDETNKINELDNGFFDLVIITDLFEISYDIYNLLKIVNNKLKPGGKVLISTLNPKWRLVASFFEILKVKNFFKRSSNTKLKKITSVARAANFEINYFYTKQLFPFQLFGLGNVLNKFLELIFFKFNLGIKSYILFSKISNSSEIMSKSLIIPAKNEEKNLEVLFEKLPHIEKLNEIVLICAESQDNTLQVANSLSSKYEKLNIKVFEQNSSGKAGAVFEGLTNTTGELIAILDSDISVEPETLNSFFEIIENGNADFVNGTRLIYPLEEKSMRYLNKLGNKFFQFIVSLITRSKLSDSLCGTKVFKKTHIEKILLWRKELNKLDPFGDFDFLFSAAFYGEKIVEYPVHYKARVYGKTQINRFRDGFKLIIYFIKSFAKFNSSLN